MALAVNLKPAGERSLTRLESLNQRRDDFVHISDDTQVGDTKNRCFRILINSNDVLGALHAD